MHETPLTQEQIDHGSAASRNEPDGLYAKLAKHPYVTSSVLLAGVGAAVAAVKFAHHDTDEHTKDHPRSH